MLQPTRILTRRRAAETSAMLLLMSLASLRVCAQDVGAGTGIGARTLEPLYDLDPRGMTYISKHRKRAPSGFLYPYPFEPAPFLSLDEGLSVRGAVDIGWITDAGDTSEAYWDDYVDRGPGTVLNRFSFDLLHDASGAYFHLDGGGADREDQFFDGELGVYGWARLYGHFDEIPHRLMHDAKTVYGGVGTADLRLLDALVAGASSEDDVDDLLADLPFQRLEIQRERGTAGLQLRPFDLLRVRLDYRREKREGARPRGGSLAFAYPSPTTGSVIETIEPIDYETQDISVALAFAHRWLQLNLSYAYSMFGSAHERLSWENPFIGAESDLGQLSLAPDNQWEHAKAELGLRLPFRGHLTATVARGRAVQDEALLPPTVNPLITDWLDPATSLSQATANAEFTTLLFDSRLRLRPWRFVSLNAEIRMFDRDDKTDYAAFNPVALNPFPVFPPPFPPPPPPPGFYGYVPEDGYRGVAGLTAFVPRFKAVPFGYTKWNAEAGATIRPGFGTTIDFAFEREKVQRDRRVREETDEDRFRLSLSNRGIPYLTLRLSYEYAERRGTDIDVTRDFGYYSDFSTGAPEFVLPLPFISGTPIRSVSELRQFDLADRNQRIFSLQGNIALAEIGDLSFTGRYDDSDYNAEYGLDFQRGGSANVELAFLPTALFNASAYATFEGKRRRMRSIHSNSAAAPFDFFVPTTADTFDPTLFNAGELIPPPFGFGVPMSVFPLENEWVVDSELNTWAFGADVEATLLGKWTLDISYSFLRANEQFDLRFASDAVLAPGLTSDDVAPNLPELKNTDHIFESSLSYHWNGQWATRLFYRYQYSTIDDFTQLALTPRIGHFLSLGRTDDDFSASVFGVTVRFRFQ